jgi:hypothetical protein
MFNFYKNYQNNCTFLLSNKINLNFCSHFNQMSQKLENLRKLFSEYKIDAYLVPHNDAHNVKIISF